MKMVYTSILTAFLISASSLAQAYIGPGAGLTAIGSVLAFIGALFLLVLGFLWYPIKRFLKRRKKDTGENEALSKTDTDNPE